MIADLWHAPSAKEAVGTATTGSSEAVHLGGLAMKKVWQQRRKAAGMSIHEPGYDNSDSPSAGTQCQPDLTLS